MKNLRKIIFAALLGLVAFSTTGCSVKLVSWQQHKEYQAKYDEVERKAYVTAYNTEYSKAVSEGRIKMNKSETDKAIDFAKDAINNTIGIGGGSAETKVASVASKKARFIAKKEVPTTYFWSWVFIHIVVAFLMLLATMVTGIVVSGEKKSEPDGFITAATIVGGIALFVIQFLTQNAAFNTHILLLQLVILGAFIITYAAIFDDNDKGRRFLSTFGPYITTIAILYLNKNTNLFAYPMLISASVWILFVSGMIISKISDGYEDGAKMVILDSFIAAAVLVLAFVLKNATYFAYIALALIFVISVIRICVSNVKEKKREAERARLRAIHAEKQAEQRRVEAEQKRIADQKAAEEKAIAEQKAEAERKAALEKAEAERKAFEAAEAERKAEEEKARQEAAEKAAKEAEAKAAAEKAAEKEYQDKVVAEYEAACDEASELEEKIAAITGKDAASIMEKAKLTKKFNELDKKIGELGDLMGTF